MKKKLYSFSIKNKKGDNNKPINEIIDSPGKELYKSFNFDSDCSQSHNNSMEITVLPDKIKECDLKKETQSEKNQSIAVSRGKPMENIVENLIGLECLVEKKKNNNDFVEFSPLNKIAQNSNITSSRPPSESLHSSKQTNLKNNIHIIKISNSKNFHIGTQQNIFFGENNFEFLHDNNLRENNLDIQINDLEELLDCEDIINESIIELVAMNLVNVECKLFGKSLGLEDHLLDDIGDRNDNKILIAYDILQSFVHHYPNTSLGFIVSILHSHCEMGVIKKISENKKEFASLK